jgi:uncharacterized protein YndB with AHSA1/START domain
MMTTRNQIVFDIARSLPFVGAVREFDAPVTHLYRAYVDPTLVVEWLGPRRFSMEIARYDVRSGGSWAYRHVASDGTTYGFHGVFHLVVPREHIVQTFEFDGAPGHVSLDSAVFEPVAGRSRLKLQSVHQSVESRDAIVSAGMAAGLAEAFARLDEVLEALAQR